MTVTDTCKRAATGAEHFRVEERHDLGQRCLRILVDRPAGEVLASFADSAHVADASYLTVQLDGDTHLELAPAFLECVNHSCAPNVAFDMAMLALVSLTALSAGDELTYFYPSTEWTMTQPFICACRAPTCIGTIEGASRLSADVLAKYALSPWVRAQLSARHPR